MTKSYFVSWVYLNRPMINYSSLMDKIICIVLICVFILFFKPTFFLYKIIKIGKGVCHQPN